MPRDWRYLESSPLALAHRGGAGYPPNQGIENTLRAFRTATELGYRYLETDVHLSADGVLFAIHDSTVDRVADTHPEHHPYDSGRVEPPELIGGSTRLRDLNAEQIRRVRIGGRESVPTLEEILTALPQVRVNIDLKAPGTAAATWRAINRCHAQDRVCIGSFTNRRLWVFRRLARGRVLTTAGRLGTVALRFLPWPISRLIHSPAGVYQIPDTVRVPLLGRLHVVTARFIDRAHRLGKQVHVWTIDDRTQMIRLLDLGVDGIVTDRIEVLRDVLQARGQWPPDRSAGPDRTEGSARPSTSRTSPG